MAGRIDRLTGISWRRSSRSGSTGGSDCVEAAIGLNVVGLRDSKNPLGPVLVFPAADWRVFLDTVR